MTPLPSPNLVVTTSTKPRPETLEAAGQWATTLGAAVVERRGSLAELCRRYEVRGVLVVSTERVTYYEPAAGLEYFYHPGMTKVRLHNTRLGRVDPMLQAMDLRPGDEVLDCTLGRGSDAALCSFAVGEQGRVVGLEVSPILAHLTLAGLRDYVDPSRALTAILRRIEALCADYRDYLPRCADNSFDVVYFDPIFHQPVEESSAMPGLRALADPAPVTPEAIREATRVARRRVVVKQRRGTTLWGELGIIELVGGPASRIEYGVIRTETPST